MKPKTRGSLLPGALVVLAAALLPAGCASRAGNAVASPGPEGPVLAEVTNDSWYDVTVYAVTSDGARRWLGTVTSMSNETYRLPSAVTRPSADLQLIGRPVGASFVYRAGPLLVSPGESVIWRLAASPATSAFRVVRSG